MKVMVKVASLMMLVSVSSFANDVVMQKQNTAFAIDGNNGARQGQQVYLYRTDTSNVNQLWAESSVDGGFVTYQKQNTSLCLDGGSGARNRQAVTLEPCITDNQDQHWEKIVLPGGTFRLEKRGTNFSIDGNNGAENRQEIYLWESSDLNVNQQWQFLGGNGAPISTNSPEVSFATLGDNGRFDEGERVSVAVNASDSDGQITSVSLSIENEFVRAERKAPYGWGSRDSALQNLSPGTYRLTAVAEDDDGLTTQATASITIVGESGSSKPNATVSNLQDLREEIQRSNRTIVMQAGNYNLADLPSSSRNLLFSGSNNTIDLVDVYIEVPVGSTDDRESYIIMDGSDNTILGGTFEDTYTTGLVEVTDFVAYNNDESRLASGLRGAPVMSINGEDNIVDGIKLTVRGSRPYGYGSVFGIGRDNSFGLDKRCGINIKNSGNTIVNAEIQMRSFCHGIYMQEDADDTTINNTLVEGRVRETNEMLAEGPGSLPAQEDYKDFEGNPIPANEVNSLAEDGIRSYGGTGSVTVNNCVVRGMRGGIRLYLASSATVTNSTAVDNGSTNWNLPSNARVTNSVGNFTYAPLNDHRLSRSRQSIDMTILPSPNAIGSHNIADVLGNDHDIVFRRASGPVDSAEQRVIVVSGNNSTIRNETEYGIVLEAGTRGNTIVSAGDVTDSGDNNVSRIPLDL